MSGASRDDQRRDDVAGAARPPVIGYLAPNVHGYFYGSILDGVMDTLDQLRDGGRVVGLVSHVAELRTRVPSQLEVTKARSGSTLRPVLDVG